MQIHVFCVRCFSEDVGFASGRPAFELQHIPDDGYLELVCDHGHRTATLIQQQKFEILSELAVRALCDGYCREAVTNFASALERLFEVYFKVVCQSRGLDPAVFERAWHPLRKSSERQIGAFASVYLLETGQPFEFLHDKRSNFRNLVIHDGKIPSRNEAVEYGQAVIDCALPLIALLHSERYKAAYWEIVMRTLQKRAERATKAGAFHATCSLSTPFGSATETLNLTDLVANYMARPAVWISPGN